MQNNLDLLIRNKFISHSGKELYFKIECDSLSNESIETLAYIIKCKYDFKKVIGIPRGGIRLAEALKQYCNPNSNLILLVDDVLTTGGSMIKAKEESNEDDKWIQGIVIFSRIPIEYNSDIDWIDPIFQLWNEDE